MDILKEYGIKEFVKDSFRWKETEINENMFHDYEFGRIEFQDYDYETDHVSVFMKLDFNNTRDEYVYIYFKKPSHSLFNEVAHDDFLKQISKMLDIVSKNKPENTPQLIESYTSICKRFYDVEVGLEKHEVDL